MDVSGVRACTFDCYGTLVDWESGIVRAVGAVLARHGVSVDRKRLIGMYGPLEAEAEAGAYRRYAGVLADVMRGYARALGFTLAPGEEGAIAASVGAWPVFEETPGFLRALRRRFRIGILSNIDEDLFALTEPKLGVTPDLVVTAERVRSYKPGEAHFREALARLGLRADEVLHIAESRRHDIDPASRLGMRTVWVNRSGDGPSASGSGSARPDFEARRLGELLERLGVE